MFSKLCGADCYVIKVWGHMEVVACSHSRRPYNPKDKLECPRACVRVGRETDSGGACSVLVCQLLALSTLCNCSGYPLG